MEITESPEFRAELITMMREREFTNRTGVHMSDLNYCLNKQALRKLQPKEDSEQDILIFSLGWATQRWLTGQDDEPGIEKDGIIVTCDALKDSVPWELKATYQSSNRPIEDNHAWIRQIKAQCYVKSCLTAYLSRFELAGDYGSFYPRGSTKEEKNLYREEHPRPTLHAYKLTFTPKELEDNWSWFKSRRVEYLKILETEELLKPILAYECGYCHYQEECKR